ncbi:FtsX-like permease family protein [Clostridium sp. KNHs214]|uniref:ABC transporter permease n=1 Tax=Clostridium sp. KNHs214 TaxID=1540257 RepID=UPI0005537D87|nr:FtsX-like permease family protein [Clostridium sp. KNHs214]
MKSFWGIIPKYLIKNKKRNFFVAISIVLSITLITSLSVMIYALRDNEKARLIDDIGGSYDVIMYYRNEYRKDTEKLIKGNNDIVENETTFISMGNSKIKDSQYSIDINGYDKKAIDLFNFKLLKGHYPEKPNEIALENWVVKKIKPNLKIGDKVNLSSMLVNGKYDLKLNNEFVLVGIFDHTFNYNVAKNIAKAYVCKEFAMDKVPDKFKSYTTYVGFKEGIETQEGFYKISSQVNFDKATVRMNIVKKTLINRINSLKFIGVALYIIVSIISSILICNIFNTSVIQRIKEFGMLRAIGASSSHIIRLVIGEGFLLGLIFIPLSIFIGNVASKGVMTLFSGYNYFKHLFRIPNETLILSFIFGFISIFLGTYFSAKKASKVSPIEAVNSSGNFKLKGNRLKEKISILKEKSKFTRNMSKVNINRNRKKFISTVVSLSISIILFIVVNYIINCSNPENTLKKQMGGDFVIACNDLAGEASLEEKYISDIEELKGVKSVIKSKETSNFIKVQPDKVTDEGMKLLQRQSRLQPEISEALKKNIYKFNCEIRGYDKKFLEQFRSNLKEGNISFDNSKEKPMVLLAQNLNNNHVTNLKVKDSIEMDIDVYENRKFLYRNVEQFIIGSILKEHVIKPQDASLTNIIIMDNELLKKYFKISGYQRVRINLDKHADYDYVENKLKGIVKNSRGVTLTSYKEELEKIKKSRIKTAVILYSIIFTVALVSIVNIFNIMSMNVMLRKKEFGMLRAIGMAKDEVNSMIRNEGLLYGIYSIIWGVSLGILFTYLFYVATRGTLMAGMEWTISIWNVLCTSLAVLVICLLAAINASRKVYSDSIVDSIRGVE